MFSLCALSDCTALAQAFRHLYVLASEPRCIDAIDVHTHESVYVPLTIRSRPSGSPGPLAMPTPGTGTRIRHADLLEMGALKAFP